MVLELRAFLAVDVTDAVRAELAALCRSFEGKGKGVRWTRPENLHLTLRFLGETDRPTVNRVISDFKARPKPKPFAVRLIGLGTFPDWKRPAIFWAGVSEGAEPLEALAQSAEAAAAAAGFSGLEREFKPHLTLGRARRPGDKELQPLVDAFRKASDFRSSEFTCGHVSLYKSDLTPEGPVYELLEKISLD